MIGARGPHLRSRQRPGKKRRPPRRRRLSDTIARICTHVCMYGRPGVALHYRPRTKKLPATISQHARILTGVPVWPRREPVPRQAFAPWALRLWSLETHACCRSNLDICIVYYSPSKQQLSMATWQWERPNIDSLGRPHG
jgi:hypothetical protein